MKKLVFIGIIILFSCKKEEIYVRQPGHICIENRLPDCLYGISGVRGTIPTGHQYMSVDDIKKPVHIEIVYLLDKSKYVFDADYLVSPNNGKYNEDVLKQTKIVIE